MLISLVAPFFPARASHWGLSPSEIGWITSCNPLGEVFGSLIATFAVEKLGNAKAGVGGMLLNSATSVVFGMAPLVSTSRSWLLVALTSSRLLGGVSTTVTYLAVFTVVCRLKPGQIGKGVSPNAAKETRGRCIRQG